jgi:Uma2 family endonuclease
MAILIEDPYALARTPPEGKVTYEQFLDWADEDTYAEWVDGEVERMSPASAEHQDLSGFLAAILRLYAEDTGAGRVLTAPFQVKLADVRRGREPDLLFVLTRNLPSLKRSFLDGPADLAVEIVSPESAVRDRETKYAEYEAGGVGEYWIIDADARRADFFVRDAEGRSGRASPGADGRYDSAVLPGFWVDVRWLWQTPLPPVRRVLRAWEEASSH